MAECENGKKKRQCNSTTVGTVRQWTSISRRYRLPTKKKDNRWLTIKKRYKTAFSHRVGGRGGNSASAAVAAAEDIDQTYNHNTGRWLSSKKVSLLAVGIDFVGGSHGSGSDLRWPRQIEDGCRLFRPLELFRTLPGFRPQPEGELEERPRVDR